MRVFVIESGSPLDLMNGLSEGKALEQICKIMGHEAVSFYAKSREELITNCDFISSLAHFSREVEKDTPIVIHLCSHGNKEGIAFGKETVCWEEIAEYFFPILSMKYGEGIYISLSACGANQHSLPQFFKKFFKEKNITPPKYIFSIDEDEVDWRDAVLNWTILYHQLDELDEKGKSAAINLLDRVFESGFGKLKYHRWDEDEEVYKRYQAKVLA